MNVKMLLQATGDTQLNYYCGDDTYLGVGNDGNGLNVMGVLMMITRAKINSKGHNSYAEEKLSELTMKIRGLELSKQITYLSTIPEEAEDD
jgi:hypothetical protein